MSMLQPTGWQGIQAEVLRRIHAREWPPGHIIPNEVDLAAEFGCARATVNRALQSLADSGVLERRRKAGTRVALHPVSRATVDIPILRHEIEGRGHTYAYQSIRRTHAPPPKPIGQTLGCNTLHIIALHLADTTPFVLEDRWINLDTVPMAQRESFDHQNANEWLLQNAPYTNGEISFGATAATTELARYLDTLPIRGTETALRVAVSRYEFTFRPEALWLHNTLSYHYASQ